MVDGETPTVAEESNGSSRKRSADELSPDDEPEKEVEPPPAEGSPEKAPSTALASSTTPENAASTEKDSLPADPHAEKIIEDSEKVRADEAGGAMEVDTPEDGSTNGDAKEEAKENGDEKMADVEEEEDEKDAADESDSSNPYASLKYVVVRNDGKPESMIKLVGLKSLFAQQLPKMPRAYIARLVLDRRHTSLAILTDNPELKDSDEEIIGGICYRAFPEMRFAEIAFCAVNAKHQVKGYGTKLMNLLKKIGAETGIDFYITYAGKGRQMCRCSCGDVSAHSVTHPLTRLPSS
jgi:hypothetical protein